MAGNGRRLTPEEVINLQNDLVTREELRKKSKELQKELLKVNSMIGIDYSNKSLARKYDIALSTLTRVKSDHKRALRGFKKGSADLTGFQHKIFDWEDSRVDKAHDYNEV